MTINSTLPTKNNLIKIRNSIKLSEQGQELLEKKKYILIKEREKYENECRRLRKLLNETYEKASLMIRRTNVEIGIEEVSYISRGVKIDNGIDIKFKTIMGVEIPSIIYENQEKETNYGIYETPISLDEAIIEFHKIKEILIELAGVENTIERLNKNIAKVQKRSNALSDIIIPRDKALEKSINEIISEREREEFSRLKVVKKNKGGN